MESYDKDQKLRTKSMGLHGFSLGKMKVDRNQSEKNQNLVVWLTSTKNGYVPPNSHVVCRQQSEAQDFAPLRFRPDSIGFFYTGRYTETCWGTSQNRGLYLRTVKLSLTTIWGPGFCTSPRSDNIGFFLWIFFLFFYIFTICTQRVNKILK